jgi:excisionase family DNA binding protein
MKTKKAVREHGDTPAAKKFEGCSVENESERRTFSVEEAGRMLGISRGAAYAHAKAGAIPTIKLGKRVLVPKAAFEKLLQGA